LDRHALIDRIEAAIHQDVGRNIAPMFEAARGGLLGTVSALAETGGPVGIITGFYVPGGTPPAAETDGPVAMALLVRGLRRAGIACRVCTDAPCANACIAALTAAGLRDVPVDVVALHGSPDAVIAAWRDAGVRLALAIERCGRTADGTARNMRGVDVGEWTTLLDDLFLAGPWRTAAIGDGGNEIGMGALPAGLIAKHIAHGDAIACITPAQHLVLAGVSHWGAYALLGGLAVLRADWHAALLDSLDPELDRTILEATLRDGPAVDGVTGQQTATIDSIACVAHHRVLAAIRGLVDPYGTPAAIGTGTQRVPLSLATRKAT
jgi:D-glutamate cyclase